MLKYMVLLIVLGQLSQAQKSFYAGRQPWYPKVLAKYTSTTTPSSAVTELGTLDNRIGANSPPSPDSSSSPVVSGDDFEKFLERVSSWPVDKQPFWYRNREAIRQHINRGVDGGDSQQFPVANNMRSPFAGSGRK